MRRDWCNTIRVWQIFSVTTDADADADEHEDVWVDTVRVPQPWILSTHRQKWKSRTNHFTTHNSPYLLRNVFRPILNGLRSQKVMYLLLPLSQLLKQVLYGRQHRHRLQIAIQCAACRLELHRLLQLLTRRQGQGLL